MSDPHSREPARFLIRRLAPAFIIIAAATLPLTLPSLVLYFSGDDLINLGYYRERPFLTFVSNLTFWSSFRRPLGGALYLILYQLFGMTPVVYYAAGLLIFYANLALLLSFLWRLTRQFWITAVGGLVATLHPQNQNIWYNFGAVYELLAYGFFLAGFIFYLIFRESGNWKRHYLLSLLCFVLALNSKEMAVTLPLLLFCYELIYGTSSVLSQDTTIKQRLRSASLRIAPFVFISGVYSLGKMFGEEAFWRENPLYRYHFDLTIYHNLHSYLDVTLYNIFHFDDSSLAWTMLGTLFLALILKNRHLLFGWSFYWIAFIPVLPLPRIWGLFLYIPLIGFALYTGTLIFEVRKRVIALLGRYGKLWPAVVSWVGFLLLTGAVFAKTFRDVRPGYLTHYLTPRQEWALFARSLVEQKPEASSRSMFLFENDPVSGWFLHFVVWLTYDNLEIRVLRAPDDVDRFLQLQDDYPDAIILSWDGSGLDEVSDVSQLR